MLDLFSVFLLLLFLYLGVKFFLSVLDLFEVFFNRIIFIQRVMCKMITRF